MEWSLRFGSSGRKRNHYLTGVIYHLLKWRVFFTAVWGWRQGFDRIVQHYDADTTTDSIRLMHTHFICFALVYLKSIAHLIKWCFFWLFLSHHIFTSQCWTIRKPFCLQMWLKHDSLLSTSSKESQIKGFMCIHQTITNIHNDFFSL